MGRCCYKRIISPLQGNTPIYIYIDRSKIDFTQKIIHILIHIVLNSYYGDHGTSALGLILLSFGLKLKPTDTDNFVSCLNSKRTYIVLKKYH